MVKIDVLLQEMPERGASDLFLKAGSRPMFRIDSEIEPSDFPELDVTDVRTVAYSLMSEEQIRYFEQYHEMDLAIGIRGVGRFRVNIFMQRSSIGLVFRYISQPDFSFEQLHLPVGIKTLSEKRRGLVLVTGTTGCGKSTTLAAMINHINGFRRCHIITIEDPIEFLHQDNMAIINQREVGFDTKNFSEALKHILRQSPDVILIGEMRDLETIQTAISASETGHLVLSTLHTVDAVQTVERIINYFPAYLHPQIRMELSLTLNGVISQRLLPHASGRGRIPAVELMVATPTIKKLLHEGKTLELTKFIEGGREFGMQTFNQALYDLFARKLIKLEDAMAYATSPAELRLMVEGIASGIKDGGPESGLHM